LVKNALATDHWASVMGIEAAHFEALSKGETALGPDGIGDKGDAVAPVALITTDNVGDDIGSAASVEVNGDHIISSIDTVGDQDFFAVTLEAGKLYNIGQYAAVAGPNGVPLSDAFIELYDANGNLIVSADGGGPNTPSGLDALLSFEAQETGTYYVNARSFDNVPEDGTNGDVVGDYELFVDEVDPNDPNVYRPYYETDSPLYSLDWGTQVNRVHQTVRNPDGEEGPRPTGNEQEAPPENAYNITDKNVITIYFAREGDVFASEDPTNPGLPPVLVSAGTKDWEKEVVNTALDQIEEVADVVYVEVDNREEADFFFTTYAGTPGPGVSLLGSMAPPDYPDEGLAQFNSGDYRWTEKNLQQGGFSYVTLVHEFGHGMGMAHPHDNGGRSGIMNGVEEESTFNYSTGDFNLNQGINTMMSYEDGWQMSPYGNAPTDAGYGYLGGPMAFDIAVLQDKYGVNEDHATGNNIYRMKDVNAAGTFYDSIWDAGGHDQIIYDGERNSKVDLRDATLEYEIGGGGFISYAHGIFGGYTIANSVTIEDARTGSGNDLINGNEVGNRLISNAGHDTVRGLGGQDAIFGGVGNDKLFGGSQNDNMSGGEGLDFVLGQTGNDRVSADAGNDVARGGDGNDRVAGGEGDDRINGNLGNDVVIGGAGIDMIAGGGDADIFVFGEGDSGSSRSTADHILDFSSDNGDSINLAQIDAIAGTAANDSFTFIGKGAFSGTAGELRYFVSDGDAIVSADTDGDKLADFVLVMDGRSQLAATDFLV
jgi:Ca2+-binding RTX toxin-like protein